MIYFLFGLALISGIGLGVGIAMTFLCPRRDLVVARTLNLAADSMVKTKGVSIETQNVNHLHAPEMTEMSDMSIDMSSSDLLGGEE